MAYYGPLDRSGLTEQAEPDKYRDIFSEFDFAGNDGGCDFFCPGCRRITECLTYEEVKEGWDSFYL